MWERFMRLRDKAAIVTGGGSGFGKVIAETFAREGAKVAVLDINTSAAESVAKRIGPSAIAVAADVAKAADVEAAIAHTRNAFGRVDIVVNNAGITHHNRPMLEVGEAEFDRLFAVNVKSIFLFAHAVVPVFQAQGSGMILNIGSTAAIRPRPGLTWYNGTKGAVHTLTKSMAIELAPQRIRVCALAPVVGETPLLASFMGQDTPETRAKFIASVPLGRLSSPQDIANAALFLCSDEASFLTGVVLEVDGGRCI
ncbi:alcohol dehydrogenase [Blastochloris tepida]|uniref:Alcohol dehydrogenase n=2 Tax=Blastochloris tepida TaxID=2233851 RepID=A0A348G3T8_9HYPH|nr:alcohol dehydrogenase [Blastochloris tepida]